MFSEQFTGGAVRAVRDLTAQIYAAPPVLYGHNSGISTRTNQVWREVMDFMARLDGIDFRQTAPLTSSEPLLRPQGLEWHKCEEALTKPAEHIKPVMIARAGGLDQGNIILNLEDVAKNLPKGRRCTSRVRPSIPSPTKTATRIPSWARKRCGRPWKSGARAKRWHSPPSPHAQSLYALAKSKKLTALQIALQQRYGLV